jgi:hypothetical protein
MTWSHFPPGRRDRWSASTRIPCWTLFLVTMLLASPAVSGEVRIVTVGGQTTARRGPGGGDGGGGGSPFLTNGSFAEGLAGWSTSELGGSAAPGGVVAGGGVANISEGDSFLVTLSQTFQVPAGPKALSFTVRLEPGFDRSGVSIPDAFEASLLDAGELPVTRSWSDQATSFINFQESGAVNSGAGVAWDGQRAMLDLSAVPGGTLVTLYFDLIGADLDVLTAVRVDDVEVTPLVDGFIRGNSNLDDVVNITDAIVVLNYLFLGTGSLGCLDAADANNDGTLNITDPIFLLGYLFLGTQTIPPPFDTCGLDEGPADELDCGPCSCSASMEGGECP